MSTNSSVNSEVLIDLGYYLNVLKRKAPSIVVIFIVLFVLGAYAIINQKKVYLATCNVRLAEPPQTNFFTMRESPINSEIIIMRLKSHILDSVIKIIHNKAKGIDPFEGIDKTYISHEEIIYIESFKLSKETKAFVLATDDNPFKFSIRNEALKRLNSAKVFGTFEIFEFMGLNKELLKEMLYVEPFEIDSNVISVKATTLFKDLSKALVNTLAIVYRADFGRSEIIDASSTKHFLEEQTKEVKEYLDGIRPALEEATIKDMTLGSPDVYQVKLSELQIELDSLEKQYTDGHELIDRQKKLISQVKEKLAEFPKARMNYEKINADWETKKAHLKTLEGLFVQARIDYDAKLLKAKEDIQIVSLAEGTEKTNKTIKLILVCFIGCFAVSFSQAIARDIMMNALDVDQLEKLSSSNVLAGVPIIKEQWSFKVFGQKFFPTAISFLYLLRLKKKRAINRVEKVLFNFDQVSPLSEAYRSIRTSLLFSLSKTNGSKAIAVTSSVPGEGKTVNTVNLAVSIAQTGKKTVLIDADMRKPKIAQIFNMKKDEIGLSDILINNTSIDTTLKSTHEHVKIAPWDPALREKVSENLYILPSGRIPHSPGDLLVSNDFKQLIKTLKKQFDYVIFDTPPGLPVADTSVISSLIDGTIIIYHDEYNGRFFTNLMKILKTSHANILGVIINCQREVKGHRYGYGHKAPIFKRFPFLIFK